MTRRIWRRLALTLAVWWVVGSPAFAAVTWWQVPTGNWSGADNWSNGEPTSSDACQISNGGTVTIDQLGEACKYLSISEYPGSIQMVAGELLVTDWENIGYGWYPGSVTFTQTGGTNTTKYFYLGKWGSLGGTYNLSGTGRLSAKSEYVGYRTFGHGGTGTFNQTGGTNTASFKLNIGHGFGSNGTYNLSGTGNVSAPYLSIGVYGTGTFTQTGGTVSSNMLTIGGFKSGTFNQTRGANTIADTLSIGGVYYSEATYNLSGGTLSAARVIVGGRGPGTLNIENGGGTTIKADGLTIAAGDPSAGIPRSTLSGSGRIQPRDAAGTSVLNNGEISAGPSYFYPGFVSSTLTQLYIEGDFTQSGLGSLSVTLDDRNLYRLHGSGDRYIPVMVRGTASLDGTLRVQLGGDFIPEVGDRFRLMTYAKLDGRFDRFEGAYINDKRFFGLDYGDDRLHVITLKTPTRVGGVPLSSGNQSDNLVLVTHGWNSNAQLWAEDLASDIRNHPQVSADWDVVAFDWRQYAAVLRPWAAANMGIDIGESISLWLEDAGFRKYKNVHLLGHSAGSWLVDALADELHKQGVSVHLTLFDAAVPPQNVMERPGYEAPPVLGDNATFAEQIVDRHWLPPFTDIILPLALNVEVTDLYNPPGDAHGWPYRWYHETVKSPVDEQVTHGFGFLDSFEYAGTLPRAGTKGWGKLYPDRPPEFVRLVPSGSQRILAENSIVSDTGTVTFDGQGGVVMETGSPVMVTTFVDLADSASLLSFDFEFLSDAEGLLSVYFDAEQIFELEESWLPEDMGPINSGDLWLGQDFQPGTYALLFRLDPLSEVQSAVRISNVEFGSYIIIPEPSASASAAIAFLALLACAWRRRRAA